MIHSDTIWVGTDQAEGHVDFYPNFGRVQPGCPDLRLTSFRDYTDSKKSRFYFYNYLFIYINRLLQSF